MTPLSLRARRLLEACDRVFDGRCPMPDAELCILAGAVSRETYPAVREAVADRPDWGPS